MALYTYVLTVELEDDFEAGEVGSTLRQWFQPQAEVLEQRHYRDLDAELVAAAAGVRWG